MEVTRRAIARLVVARSDTATFAAGVVEALQRVVPHQAACVLTVDPESLLLTGTYKFGGLAGRHESDHEWAQLEYGTDDPTAMVELAGAGVPAAAVSHLPGGIAASPRASALLGAAGLCDELRMVARADGLAWGGVNLFRAIDAPPFSARDVATVAALSDLVATGLRAGVVSSGRTGIAGSAGSAAPGPGTSDGPAVIIVDALGRQRHISPTARELLGSVIDEAHRSPADSFVHGLVATVRRRGRTGELANPRVRIRLGDGRWMVCRAGLLQAATGSGEEDVVVTVEAARPLEVAPLLAAAFGLTAREREVTDLVVRGLHTKAIAGALHVSTYTVQDHLKAIFAKVDVRSRRELVARVYFDEPVASAV